MSGKVNERTESEEQAAAQAETEAAMRAAFSVLRAHCGELERKQKARLKEILDRAEADGDQYTVLYTLMLMEIELRDTRERLARCLHEQKFIDKEVKQ